MHSVGYCFCVTVGSRVEWVVKINGRNSYNRKVICTSLKKAVKGHQNDGLIPANFPAPTVGLVLASLNFVPVQSLSRQAWSLLRFSASLVSALVCSWPVCPCFSSRQASALVLGKPLLWFSASLCSGSRQASALVLSKSLLWFSASLCSGSRQAWSLLWLSASLVSALVLGKPGLCCGKPWSLFWFSASLVSLWSQQAWSLALASLGKPYL